jgi:phenylalanine-4-hydroxylase
MERKFPNLLGPNEYSINSKAYTFNWQLPRELISYSCMRVAPKKEQYRDWSEAEHSTWKLLFTNQTPKRDDQIYEIFSEGVKKLGFTNQKIPNINEVNKRLEKLTGWRGVPVTGLEEDHSFYYMIADKQFPIGNFIRDPKDLSYTPAPDVFHDLYGHMPFFCDKDYGDFVVDLGKRAINVSDSEWGLKQFARLFWFTIEFALVKTPKGKRIFGAGIASSFSECAYALSEEPEVIPFDLETIRNQDFRIDDFQRKIFMMESPEQLYSCLNKYEAAVKKSIKEQERA